MVYSDRKNVIVNLKLSLMKKILITVACLSALILPALFIWVVIKNGENLSSLQILFLLFIFCIFCEMAFVVGMLEAMIVRALLPWMKTVILLGTILISSFFCGTTLKVGLPIEAYEILRIEHSSALYSHYITGVFIVFIQIILGILTGLYFREENSNELVHF